MYLDCHGHFTGVPPQVTEWRKRQIKAIEESGHHTSPDELEVSDDELVAAIGPRLKLQADYGITASLLSPSAGSMGHHHGDQQTSTTWTRIRNDHIARVCGLLADRFIGVGQLPQSPGAPIDDCVDELHRGVVDLGFVGFNLNPDPSDGYWQSPPVTDEYYYPLYEKAVELDVPLMVHTSRSCNPAVHGTCGHYLNGDTTVFMQLCVSDLFETFPTLRMIIPHGGGAVPYHWGRYRGVLQDKGRPEPEAIMADNIFFDTCVYLQAGLQLLVSTIPIDNIIYASEMIGAVRGVDPRSGRRYDDTRYLLDNITTLSDAERKAIASGNALRVYGRLAQALSRRGHDPVAAASAGRTHS